MASPSLPPAIKAASWLRGVAGVAGAALVVASCSGGGGGVIDGTGGHTMSISISTSLPPSRGPHLVVPAVIDIPYVVAGQGGATAVVPIANDGDAPLTGLAWLLRGDPSISLGGAPSTLAAGETAELQLTWSGSATEAIAQASLAVTTLDPPAQPAGGDPSPAADIPVFAVAGDPGLGSASWDEVEGAGGVLAGAGITVAMPAAPYPDGTGKLTDASVRVFLPEGYRDRGAHDVVLHFHGWNTTVASTLAAHLYQQHLYASGSNAVLVVPQGPIDAPSGDFGKLMVRGGISRLLTEVLVVLYREGKITHPVRGDLVITAHSGGYQAVAAALDSANQVPRVTQVGLFDALYGYETIFETFALGGGVLRSSYTESGGALATNQEVAAHLGQRGLTPAVEPTRRALRDDAPVVHFAATTHDGTTRLDGAYGEALRWKLHHSRRGPRIELREVSALANDGGDPHTPGRAASTASARWLAPADEDVTGFVVETSTDGIAWTTAATAAARASDASFPLAAGARVRIKAAVTGVDPEDVLPSDTYRVDPAARVLVVDGFDRLLDGSFGGLQHDFAARVGEALGPVATISHRAVTEDGFDLTAWPAVVWLLGDASTMDLSLSTAEQTALLDYVNGGGHLVMSGSELAFDVGQTPAGAMFLAECFGAAFLADDAASHEIAGQGPLASLASFALAGPGAPYALASPDALEATADGEVLLEYGSGKPAAVGRAGRGVLVGFPLELCGAGSQLGAVAQALLAFAGAT